MITAFFVGLYGIGKTSIIFKNKNCLLNRLKLMGYNASGYSLDNYAVYDNLSVFHAQIERLYYGSRKLREAVEDHPHIALFDRSLFCNLLFSKCYLEFKLINEREFLTIRKIFQSVMNRNICFDGRVFYLKPPLQQAIAQVKERNKELIDGCSRDGKVCPILLREEFIKRLDEIYEEFYEQYELVNPVYRLKVYDESSILKEMEKHDMIQQITD